ncbi:MAG: bifunctional 23S rRNA (guanine(2069)-N(7))-methyltransferase RlmK/23S rRNA (guanine(2445)-N(2))-methyltransferase RlmL, partial [Eggerthellaceae bacterium]|nr:bifunctional 23S rRNA (guanine(2069)-N(7))-methyltransferase RlmK/23S rRNA (guanine(2445)-N(2))-methyltransferase RlmL [Eggerthellaceae bacterium]
MTHCSNAEDYEFFATCLAGAEKLLAEELKSLGAQRVRPLGGGAAFFGGALSGERVCLWSRIASRVMLVVKRVNAGDADLLYAGVYAIPWEEVLASGSTVAVRASGTNEQLRNTQFTALKVKDALCDRMRSRTGERPMVDAQCPDAQVEVRVRDGRATVSLDLSGESLHRRSYFDEHDGGNAPLACAYAASMLALAGWFDAGDPSCFFDPVCEDGFALAEAAMAACGMAPGLLRERWGFRGWAAHDEDAWAMLLDEADARFEAGLERYSVRESAKARFVGVSASSPSVARARVHVKRAGVRDAVSVEYAEGRDAVRVAERVAALGQTNAGGFGMLIASAFASDRDQDDARAVSEASAFVASCSAVPESARYACCAAEGMEARFGVRPMASAVFGKGRIEVPSFVFDCPPAAPCTIVVPDAHGGAEHRVEVHDAASGQFASRLRKMAKE